MDASVDALGADDRANALYWGSDMSVNQIADALDLSKGALYEIIRPLAADVACPRCGAETVHPNRTAQERGLVACQECGWGDQSGGTAPSPSVWPALARPAPRSAAPAPRRRPVPAARAEPEPPDGSALAVGLLLGAAAGLALLLWARRK
jgi:predicted RNA-binding Zn-ribbon protein involved in translation (DUF1610 family)